MARIGKTSDLSGGDRIGSGGDPSAEGSLWDLGLRLELEGDLAGAQRAYAQAAHSGEIPTESRAILRYAEQLEGLNTPLAEAEFLKLIEVEDPYIRAAAWRGVARYRFDRNEVDEGLAALREVIATGDPDETPRALRNIGTFQEDLGNDEAAREAYEKAIGLNHPAHSQGARVNLAQLLRRHGDHAAAATLFRQAIDANHPSESPRAAVLLAGMLDEQGDPEQALDWLKRAMDGPDKEWRQRAAIEIAGIYIKREDHASALEYLRIGAQLPYPVEAARAHYLLGMSEAKAGTRRGALEAYEKAAQLTSDPDLRAQIQKSADATRYLIEQGLR
jgi:tetratricopeptide (TPR) repeat protein